MHNADPGAMEWLERETDLNLRAMAVYKGKGLMQKFPLTSERVVNIRRHMPVQQPLIRLKDDMFPGGISPLDMWRPMRPSSRDKSLEAIIPKVEDWECEVL